MDTQHGRQPCNLTDYTDGTLQQKYTAYTQANLGNLPKRYHNPALDPHSVNPLLEQIGEDLRSSSEETYMDASSALPYACVALGGHLIDALDERETHYEGWRHEKGKDQRLVNEGVDGFSQLYSTFIKQNSQMHRAADLDSLFALNLPERYYRVALTSGFTKSWFELIDEDFSDNLQEVREIAWIAFSFSYISNLEEEMNTEGTQDVYVRCYEKLVKEGAFTRPRKHKIARVYFRCALDNAKRNKDERRPDPILLKGEEWEAELNKFLTESAEDEGLRNIGEEILYNELVPDYLSERQYPLFYAVYGEDVKIKDLAQRQGKSPHGISQALYEARDDVYYRMILRRDICIATKIRQWDMMHCGDSHRIDFSDHHDFFVHQVEEAMKPGLRSIASLNHSLPFLLPLTSGIAKQPGRLYLTNTGHPQLEDLLHNYLLAQGIDPSHYYLYEQGSTGEWSRFVNRQSSNGYQRKYYPQEAKHVGIPVLDKIIKQLQSTLSNRDQERITLCILNSVKSDNLLDEPPRYKPWYRSQNWIWATEQELEEMNRWYHATHRHHGDFEKAWRRYSPELFASPNKEGKYLTDFCVTVYRGKATELGTEWW